MGTALNVQQLNLKKSRRTRDDNESSERKRDMAGMPGETTYLPDGGGDRDDQPESVPTFSAIIEGHKMPVMPVGTFTPGNPVKVRLADGEEVTVPWKNFARD